LFPLGEFRFVLWVQDLATFLVVRQRAERGGGGAIWRFGKLGGITVMLWFVLSVCLFVSPLRMNLRLCIDENNNDSKEKFGVPREKQAPMYLGAQAPYELQ